MSYLYLADDPLVPEIARIYKTDRKTYACRRAQQRAAPPSPHFVPLTIVPLSSLLPPSVQLRGYREGLDAKVRHGLIPPATVPPCDWPGRVLGIPSET